MVEPVKLEICIFPDPGEVSEAAAEKIAGIAHDAVSKKGRFTMALSGGQTPRPLYRCLATHYSNKMPWPDIHIFWGDERCVPKEDDDSNFNLAHRTFLSKVALPPENIHRIQAERKNLEDVTRTYEEILRRFFTASDGEPEITFDLTLLGLGKDGHIASLFPSNPALEEQHRWVVDVDAPPPVSPSKRITLTYPLINRSEMVFFLVTGAEKREVVRSIFQDLEKAKRMYPAAKVSARDKIIWYLDQRAMHDIANIS